MAARSSSSARMPVVSAGAGRRLRIADARFLIGLCGSDGAQLQVIDADARWPPAEADTLYGPGPGNQAGAVTCTAHVAVAPWPVAAAP